MTSHALWNELATRASVALAHPQRQRLDRYLDLLLEANQTMNLTRIEDRASAERLHVADSLTLLPFIPAGPRRGLVVVSSPGFDQISTPALFLGGAQLVGFATGRGTGVGCALGPVLKISTNSALARDNEDIDVDAGGMLPGAEDGEPPRADLPATGQAIFDRVLAIANGDYRPRAEASSIHDEFKIWESLWPAN